MAVIQNLLLGVTGSIACYKACGVVSELTQEGISVHVVLTKTAANMVSPETFETLSQNRTYTDLYDDPEGRNPAHIALADDLDLLLIAPATANVIGKIANGIADDLLTSVVMANALRAPVLLAPAMNSNMYENPLVQKNIKTLKEQGYRFIEPDEGYMACGDLGPGRLADEETVLQHTRELLNES